MIFYFGNGCDKDATSYQHILLLTLQFKLAIKVWLNFERNIAQLRFVIFCKIRPSLQMHIHCQGWKYHILIFCRSEMQIHEVINQVQFECFWLLFSSLKNDSFMIDQLYWLGGELVKYFTQLRSPNFTWEKLANRVIFANKLRKENVLLISFKGIVSFFTQIQTNYRYLWKASTLGKLQRKSVIFRVNCWQFYKSKNI